MTQHTCRTRTVTMTPEWPNATLGSAACVAQEDVLIMAAAMRRESIDWGRAMAHRDMPLLFCREES